LRSAQAESCDPRSPTVGPIAACLSSETIREGEIDLRRTTVSGKPGYKILESPCQWITAGHGRARLISQGQQEA
jgi:hypothetical protein